MILLFKNLDTDLKMILLDHQNYVGHSNIMSNAAKKFWRSSNQLERST